MLFAGTQYASKFGKLNSDYRTQKDQFFIPISKKGNAKECSNMLISQASKQCSKSFKLCFNSTWTKNFKMVLFKCCTQYTSKSGKLSSDHRTGKGQFSFQSQRKVMPNYHTIALISHTNKIMLKILQAKLQQYMNCELPDVQAGLREGRGTRDQIANIRWVIEKVREFQKNILYWLQ